MAEIEISSPFLSPEDDFFDLEAVTSMMDVASSARCGRSKQWLGAYLGEKVTPAPPQTSVPLDPTHSLWYESMQDMSGFVLSDIILPPLDEQLDLTISTAQTENDFYVQNPGLPPPTEFILGDTFEGVISEDSNMFDNSNCEALGLKTSECQPESPIKRNLCDYMHSNQTRTTKKMGDTGRNFVSQKLPFFRPKVKLAATFKNKKPKYLAIIDSEEPLIKDDPDLLYCTQNKMDYDIKADVDVSDIFSSEEPSINEDMDRVYCSADFKDMGVAEEVVVMTEGEDKYKTNLNISLLDTVSSEPEEDIHFSEEKPKKEVDVVFRLDPFTGLETVMDNLFNDLDEIQDDLYSQIEDDYHVEDNLYSQIEDDYCVSSKTSSEAMEVDHLASHSISPLNDLLSNCANNKTPPLIDLLSNTSHQTTAHNPLRRHPLRLQMTPKPVPKHVPLTLDIGAARAALLVDKGISDTPELLEALKPEVGKFDLIKFITTNGDPNNNAISPPIESCPKKIEVPRKGKSHLSLLDLKQAQKHSRGKPLSRAEDEREENETLPSTSGTSPSGRPARQSATRFKKMIEEGLLSSVVDSRSVSSDEEDDEPKAKRRRTTSTASSRRRLNSDSDRSSICEDAMKYRERRDRNNLSSKRSRQKRKMHYCMKQKELKELEDKNARLRLKADRLESELNRVKAAWADYLAHMNDHDKDRGVEH